MQDKQPHRLVIAEDEYLIALDVADAAQKAGYEVVGTAPNGLRALELVAEQAPDAAILDIKMPRMDGLEAARQIRDRFSIPVILMTAYETREFLDQAREAGVGAYLVKPADAVTLQRAVELAVARHEDLLELRRVNAELREALTEIRTLRDILPICCHCKKIRDDAGYWNRVEDYIEKRTATRFSHGICPDCIREHYGEEIYRKFLDGDS